jgi:hypothetical protein
MSAHKLGTTDACTQARCNRCLHTSSVQQMYAHKLGTTDVCTQARNNRCLHTSSEQQTPAHKLGATDVCTQARCSWYQNTSSLQPMSAHKTLLDSSRPSRTQFVILTTSVTWLSPHLCFRLEDLKLLMLRVTLFVGYLTTLPVAGLHSV